MQHVPKFKQTVDSSISWVAVSYWSLNEQVVFVHVVRPALNPAIVHLQDPSIGACLADADLEVITVGWLFEEAG